MMILKEVMEKVTGRTFKDLVNHYIIVKLGVPNTHLVVPNFKTDLITGTPNAQYGLPNDKTAVILGGYSGHAGMFSTSKDLITAGKGATSILLPEDKIHYLWTQGLKLNRGYMGNTYVPLGGGLKDTLVDVYSLRRSFAVQGSTRGQLNAGVDHASTILLNPSSMSYEQAEELLGKNPRTVQKYFAMKDGKQIECKLIDPRTIVPIDNVSPITTANAKLTLKLMFLKYIFQKENYEKEVKVKRRVI